MSYQDVSKGDSSVDRKDHYFIVKIKSSSDIPDIIFQRYVEDAIREYEKMAVKHKNVSSYFHPYLPTFCVKKIFSEEVSSTAKDQDLNLEETILRIEQMRTEVGNLIDKSKEFSEFSEW